MILWHHKTTTSTHSAHSSHWIHNWRWGIKIRVFILAQFFFGLSLKLTFSLFLLCCFYLFFLPSFSEVINVQLRCARSYPELRFFVLCFKNLGCLSGSSSDILEVHVGVLLLHSKIINCWRGGVDLYIVGSFLKFCHHFCGTSQLLMFFLKIWILLIWELDHSWKWFRHSCKVGIIIGRFITILGLFFKIHWVFVWIHI